MLLRIGLPSLLIGALLGAPVAAGDELFVLSDELWVPSISALAAGDLNGDGDVDLLAGSQDHWISPERVRVYKGVGDGSFFPGSYDLITRAPNAMELADLDGDGDLDLVLVAGEGAADGVLVSHLGHGTGAFAPGTSHNVFGTERPQYLALGDLDGDGVTDAVTVATGSQVFALLGQGDGSFVVSDQFFGGTGLIGALLGDVDGNGDLDLLMPTNATVSGDTRFYLALGDGVGSFGPSTQLLIDGGGHVDDSQLVDIDGDGALDLLFAVDEGLRVALGHGDGSFAAAPLYPGKAGAFADGLALGDADGDGDLDAVITWPGLGEMGYWAGDGAGGFGPVLVVPAGTRPELIVAADLDGNGLMDLAVKDEATPTLADDIDVYRNTFGPWSGLGHTLPGSAGPPALIGTGTLGVGTPGALNLTGGTPGAASFLVASPFRLDAPLYGGVLVPDVTTLIAVPLDGVGGATVPWAAWPFTGPFDLYVQWWIDEPGGPFVWAASNALQAAVP